MRSPPGWPLGLDPEIAARYRDAAGELQRCWRGEPENLSRAILWAVNSCEQARRYRWPQVSAAQHHNDTRDAWTAASRNAASLAAYLEGMDGLGSLWRGLADTERASLIRVLRRFAGQPFCMGRDARARRGPFEIALSGRERWPDSDTILLTAALAHVLRCARDGAWVENRLSGGAYWAAAVAFAIAAVPAPERDDIAAAAKKWLGRHASHLKYWGWRGGQ